MAVGTQRIDVPMAVAMQWMVDKLMAACTWYSGDDLDTMALHPSQWKMKKRQWMGIRPMAASTHHMDFSPRAETNIYLKQARQIGNSLIPASMQ